MKKLIAVAALIMGIAFNSNAQSKVTMPTVAGDTIVDAGTVTKTFSSTASLRGVAVQVVLTRVSGTGAGTVEVQGSLDGSNYKTIGSAATITNVASQSFNFYVTAPCPQYFKVLYTGSGTEVVATKTYYRLAQ